jgi:hypothetical protein
MHSDVGGGYPDDGLSFVPLNWMIEEATKKDLRFESTIVDTYQALALPTGPSTIGAAAGARCGDTSRAMCNS